MSQKSLGLLFLVFTVSNSLALTPIGDVIYNNISSPHARSKKVAVTLAPSQEDKRPKILILSSDGGGGHNAAAQAIKAYLENDYQVTIVNAFCEIFSSCDTLRFFSFNTFSEEDFYNSLLRYNWTWLLGKICTVGLWLKGWKKGTMAREMRSYLRKHPYDMVISVAPIVNASVLEAAKSCNIPFLVIPTDLDLTTFTYGMYEPNYSKFHFLLAYDEPTIRQTMEHAKIPEDRIVVGGFPLRPSFFEQKDVAALKMQYNIPLDKPVVMVLMGSVGTQACYKYVRRILKDGKIPLHLLVCTGKNEALKERLEQLPVPGHISLTIFGFTDKIADLMAMSDVLLTKPGTVSFNEGIKMDVPMLLDHSSSAIFWEDFNFDFAQTHVFGEPVYTFRHVNRLLEKYLKDQEQQQRVRSSMASFNKGNFPQTLTAIVHKMLHPEPLFGEVVVIKERIEF